MVVASFGSSPWIACSTLLQSAAVRHIGPSLSSVQAHAIAPCRLTAPYVGRSPVTPENALGVTIDPEVSLPMANGTSAAPTAAPGPPPAPPAREAVLPGFSPGPGEGGGCFLGPTRPRQLDHRQLRAEHRARVG